MKVLIVFLMYYENIDASKHTPKDIYTDILGFLRGGTSLEPSPLRLASSVGRSSGTLLCEPPTQRIIKVFVEPDGL
jgi:hypothetical protein